MNNAPLSSRQRHLAIFRSITPAQRLEKSFELTELAHQRTLDAIRKRFPNASDAEVQRIFLERRMKFLACKTARERRIAGRWSFALTRSMW
jgi:hypothetical protein